MAHGFWTIVLGVALVACGSEEQPKAGSTGAGAGGEDQAAGAANAGSTSGGALGAGGGQQDGGAPDPGGGAGVGGPGMFPEKLCATSQPFGTPEPLTTLNTTAHEAGPRLTPDELTLIYLCGDDASLCIAQRATRSDDFELVLLGVEQDAGVGWLSDDGLVTFFESDVTGQLSFAQRSSTEEPFPLASALTLDGMGDPFVVGGQDGHLYLSDSYPGDLFVSKLTAWEPDAPQLVPGASTTARDVRPVLTPDELTLYFGSTEGGSDLDVWVRERQSREDEFGPAVNVAGLNGPDAEFPGWISPDNCRLYFDSGDVVRDLYVAERTP
jgi:hypothetical protein